MISIKSDPLPFMGLASESLSAERATLGCVLVNKTVIHDLVDILGEDSSAFDERHHQHVYEAFLGAYSAGRPIDVITVIEALRQHDEEPAEGWPIFVTNLAASVPTSVHVREYARLVRETFEVAQAVEACRIISEAKRPGDLLAHTLSRLTAITSRTEETTLAGADVGIDEVVRELEARARGEFTAAIATEYKRFDEMMRGGLHPGETIVVAARTSDGKTALMLNIAINVARRGTPVFFASAEMSRKTLLERAISICGGVNTQRIYAKWRCESELARARNGADEFRTLPIFIDDTPAIGIGKLVARASIFARKNPRALFVIDYLQLIQSGQRFGTREAEVAFLSREIKRIARQTNCPVLLACQLSRESEKETDHFRKLACLRESGAIEQDADVVVVLARLTPSEVSTYSNEYKGATSRLNDASVLCIAKQRNGPTGKMLLHFDRTAQRFSDFDAITYKAPDVEQGGLAWEHEE